MRYIVRYGDGQAPEIHVCKDFQQIVDFLSTYGRGRGVKVKRIAVHYGNVYRVTSEGNYDLVQQEHKGTVDGRRVEQPEGNEWIAISLGIATDTTFQDLRHYYFDRCGYTDFIYAEPFDEERLEHHVIAAGEEVLHVVH